MFLIKKNYVKIMEWVFGMNQLKHVTVKIQQHLIKTNNIANVLIKIFNGMVQLVQIRVNWYLMCWRQINIH